MGFKKDLKILELFDENFIIKNKCFEKYIKIITNEQNEINQILSKYNFKIDWKIEYNLYSQSEFELQCNSKEDFNNIVNDEIKNIYIKTLEYFLKKYGFGIDTFYSNNNEIKCTIAKFCNGITFGKFTEILEFKFSNINTISKLDIFIKNKIIPIIVKYYKDDLDEIKTKHFYGIYYKYLQDKINEYLFLNLCDLDFFTTLQNFIINNTFNFLIDTINLYIKNEIQNLYKEFSNEFVEYFNNYKNIITEKPTLQGFKDYLISNLGNEKANDLIDLFKFYNDFFYKLLGKNISILEIAPDNIVNNIEFMIELIKYNNDAAKYLRELKRNFSFIKKLVEIDYKLLKYVDQSILYNKDLLLILIKIDYRILEFVDIEIRNDYKFILEAIEINSKSYNYIGNELEKNMQFCIIARSIILKNKITKTLKK